MIEAMDMPVLRSGIVQMNRMSQSFSLEPSKLIHNSSFDLQIASPKLPRIGLFEPEFDAHGAVDASRRVSLLPSKVPSSPRPFRAVSRLFNNQFTLRFGTGNQLGEPRGAFETSRLDNLIRHIFRHDFPFLGWSWLETTFCNFYVLILFVL